MSNINLSIPVCCLYSLDAKICQKSNPINNNYEQIISLTLHQNSKINRIFATTNKKNVK